MTFNKKRMTSERFKTALLGLLMIVVPFEIFSQTSHEIIKGCWDKINSLDNYTIQYSGINYSPPTNPDTLFSNAVVYSKKVSQDTVIGINFYTKNSRSDCGESISYYTTDKFYTSTNNIGKLTPKDKYFELSIAGQVGADLYFRVKSFWIRNLMITDSSARLEILKDTIVNGEQAFHIQGRFTDITTFGPITCFQNRKAETKKRPGLITEFNLYISKKDSLPVITRYKRTFNGDLELFVQNTIEFKNINQNEQLKIPNDFIDNQLFKKEIVSDVPEINNSKEALSFCLLNSDSVSVCLDSAKSKKKLLVFSIQGCKPCVELLTSLKELNDEIDKNEVSLFYVTLFPSPSKLKAYKDNKQIDFEMLLGTKELWREHKITGFPTLLLLDKDNNLIKKTQGFKTKDELIEYIDY